ncbi:hypothetical protein WJ69_02325 [Burkholderia ubonensis]|nr:hypothetical protein WJ69_02325 [Burkholderia ubonensis]
MISVRTGVANEPNADIDDDGVVEVEANVETPDVTASGVNEALENGPDAVRRFARPRRSAQSPSAESQLAASTPGADIPGPEYVDGETAYRRAIEDSLSDWVDYDKTREDTHSPYRILQAVFDRYNPGQPIPKAFETTLDVSLLGDAAVLDEAALLYRQLQQRVDAAGTAGVDSTPTTQQLRSRFLEVLRPDCEMRLALHRLLVSSPDRVPQAPFFDGFAIRNAFGKSFEELAQSPGLSTDSAFAGFSADRKRELLEAKFAEMGESTQYKIGTPQHSLASALIRIAKYRGQAIPASFESEEALVQTLEQVEAEWSRDSTTFPVHPRLLVAMHLARTSGVEIMSTTMLEARYQEILNQAIAHRTRTGEWDAPLWLQSVPAKWNADGKQWMRREDCVKRQALLATLDALRDMSDKRQTPSGVVAERVWALAERVKQAGLLRPVLVGDDWREKTVALLNYANERLRATFTPAPTFSPENAAGVILKRHGMSDAELARARDYVVIDGLPPQPKRWYGTPVSEFLFRIGATHRLGAQMTVGSTTILPQAELQAEQEKFNAALKSDVWVRARAEENLRMRSLLATNATIKAEVTRILGQYETETANTQTWKRIGLTILNMAPFAGSGYNLIRGIIDGDARQALTGLIGLAFDVGGAVIGSGGRGGSPTGRQVHIQDFIVRQRSGLRDFHDVTTALEIPAVRVAEYADAITLAEEPPDIRVQDGNVPGEHRPLATRVRNGESGVTWQGHDVVLLENEDRVVPVKHEGGSYHEIDWHTGHRARHAGLIERDRASGKFRSSAGLKGGMVSDRLADSAGLPIKDRMTSMDVERILTLATDSSMRDFQPMFHECFSVIETRANALQGWNVEGLYRRLYERSPTFRRLFNHHHATTPRGQKLWKLKFGAGGPSNEHFAAEFPDRREIVLPAEHEFGDQKFVSASGKRPTTKENVLLHETLHMLTGLRDPNKVDTTASRRVKSDTDRGAIVYLTDKILSEAGFEVEERVIYRELNEGHRLVPAAVRDAHRENRYLDAIVDADQPPVTADTLVEEQRIADRLTVKQWREAESKINAANAQARGGAIGESHWDKLKGSFEFLRSTNRNPSMKALVKIAHRLLAKSATFRALIDGMSQLGEGGAGTRKWTFEFDAVAAAADFVGNTLGIDASRARRKVYVFDDGSIYLSSEGPRRMEHERRVVSGFVNALTDLQMPSMPVGTAYKNRGGAVLLTDKILAEAEYHFPKQIAAARLASDEAGATKLRSYQTAGRRSAAVEDRYFGQGSVS